MKNIAKISLILVFLFPLFANASWWNPLDWFSYLFTPKVYESAVIEAPVALKEPVVEPVVEIQATTTEATSTPVEKKTEVKTAPKNTPKKVEVVAPKITPIASVVVQSRDYVEEYRTILTRYFKLRDLITTAKDQVITSDSGNLLYTNRAEYLKDVETAVNGYIAEISKLENVNPKPEDVITKHLKISNDLVVGFNAKKADYDRDVIRYRTLTYIEDTQNNLTNTGVHIQVADMLYTYDKTFGTNYAEGFRKTKTVEETTEFVRAFLSDVRNR